MHTGKKILVLCLALLSIRTAVAQYHYKPVYYPYAWSAGIGYHVYQGDLTPSFIGSAIHGFPSITLGLKYYMSRSFDIRFNGTASAMYGDDRFYRGWRHERRFNFFSPLGEGSAMLELDFAQAMRHVRYHMQKLKYTPYIMGGVSYIYFNPVIDYSKIDKDYFLNDGLTYNYELNSTKFYPHYTRMYLGGVGLKRVLSKQNAINIELIARFSTSDWLDGFHYAVLPNNDSFWNVTVAYVHYLKHGHHRHTILPCPRLK